jgi:hypothetical protein
MPGPGTGYAQSATSGRCARTPEAASTGTPGPALSGRCRGRPGPRRPNAQRRDLGATRRVPSQSRPALTLEVCESPALGAASPISLGST